MPSFDEIAELVSEYFGVERSALTEATTLLGDLGLSGVDNEIFMIKYAKRFRVDMSGYRWYFHSREDFNNIGALFFRPPNKRVKHIPITIGMLHEFAQAGRWNIQYPNHTLPPRRLDILLTVIISLCLLAFVFAYALLIAD